MTRVNLQLPTANQLFSQNHAGIWDTNKENSIFLKQEHFVDKQI